MTPDSFLTSLKWRYATKKFDTTRKVSEDIFSKLLDAARLAPSSYGLQPWKLVVVRDPAIRAELKTNAWNQAQITDASHLVVLCSRKEMTADYIGKFIETIAQERGVKIADLQGYKDMMLSSLPTMQGEGGKAWMTHQVYLALGMLLSACALAQIDACPMEGFDRPAFDRILKLSDKGIESRVLCTVGYRAADDHYAQAKKVRAGVEQVVVNI